MNTTFHRNSTNGSQERPSAYELAKKALGFVAQYRTPPSPEVFEVWYRFAEGLNKPLAERMTYLLDIVGSVSAEDLHQLRSQFLSSDESTRTSQSISKALANEISNLKMVVGDQLTANDDFNESISTAKTSLDAIAHEDSDLKSCIHSLSACTSEISQKLQQTRQQLLESQELVEQLKLELDEVRAESLTDPLTGLGNRRFLREELESAVKTPRENGVTFLAMLDLDNFKQVNDNLGHVVGDEALLLIAQELRRLASGASVGRYGGDEFCLIHHVDHPSEVHEFAELIRESFASLRFTASTGDEVGPITISVGVARLRSEDNVQQWVSRVDSLTYSAKASGKNFVMVERDLAAV